MENAIIYILTVIILPNYLFGLYLLFVAHGGRERLKLKTTAGTNSAPPEAG